MILAGVSVGIAALLTVTMVASAREAKDTTASALTAAAPACC
jgi:hypothetical protein